MGPTVPCHVYNSLQCRNFHGAQLCKIVQSSSWELLPRTINPSFRYRQCHAARRPSPPSSLPKPKLFPSSLPFLSPLSSPSPLRLLSFSPMALPPSDCSPFPISSSRLAFLVAGSAAVGSLLFGYDTGVIGGALLYVVPALHLEDSPELQGAVVSAALLGALPGTALAGPACDAFGRRSALLLAAALFVLGGMLMAAAEGVEALIVGRATAGIAIGIASGVVPVYIAECAPAAMRGRLATLPQFMVSTGILLSYCTAFILSLASAPQWRLMLGFSVLPGLVFGGLILYLPESPRFLCLRGRRADALSAAIRLGLPSDELPAPEEVAKEMEGHMVPPINDELQQEHGDGETTELLQQGTTSDPRGWQKFSLNHVNALLHEVSLDMKELLGEKSSRKAFSIGCLLQAFQQMCGINAIVYYTPEILRSAGAVDLIPLNTESASILATIIAYSVKLPSIALAMSLIDVFGRRILLLYSIPLMGLALAALGLSFQFLASGGLRAGLAMASIALYGCSFVFGLGPIPTIVCSEIFPTHLRGSAVGLCVAVNFLCNLLVSQTFPDLLESVGPPRLFGAYSLVCGAAWVFVYLALPETKGLRLEDVGEFLRGNRTDVCEKDGGDRNE